MRTLRPMFLASLALMSLLVVLALMPSAAAAAKNVDLSIQKFDNPDPVLQGDNITYLLVVRNSNANNAGSVFINDTLPAGVTYLAFNSTAGGVACTSFGTSVNCTLGNVNKNVVVNITLKVRADTLGDKLNTVIVGTTEDIDTAPANNTAQATTTVIPRVAELAISKTDSQDPVKLGDMFVYNVTVNNSGPQNATSVFINDTLPNKVSFVSASGALCNEGPTGFIECTVAKIPAGTGVSVLITVEAIATGDASNTASVAAAEDDNNPANDVAVERTTIVAREADLNITKRDSDDPVVVGQSFTYILNVTNGGPDDANNVNVTDTLPDGVAFQSASPGCTEWQPGTVTCELALLPNGASAEFSISVQALEPGVWTNAASAMSDEDDNDLDDNTVEEQTTIDPLAPGAIQCTSGKDKITITWGGVLGADSYRLYRAEGAGSFSLLVETTNTTWEDATVIPEQVYRYRVTSVDNQRESAPSQECESAAVPLFPTFIVAVLAGVAAIGAYAVWRRKN